MKKPYTVIARTSLYRLFHRVQTTGRVGIGLLGLATIVHSGGLQAHEFWLSPDTFSPRTGQPVELTAYIGEGLEGTAMPFLTTKGAMSVEFKTPGLQVFSYEPDIALHRYPSFQDFERFAKDEGLNDAVATHRQRQLPNEYFTEIVKRFNKTYLCVTAGEHYPQDVEPLQVDGSEADTAGHIGKPQPLGFDTDLQLMAISQGHYQLQLDRHSRPLPDYPITIFHKRATGEVNRWQLHTDASGQISLDAEADSQYLFNSVVLDTPSQEDMVQYGAVWQSEWASLLLDTGNDCADGSYSADFSSALASQPG